MVKIVRIRYGRALKKRIKISGAHCLMDNSDCVDMLVRVGHESDKGLGGTKKK